MLVETVRSVLTGQSFIEKTMLLLFTLTLSGLVVPYIVSKSKEGSEKEKALYSAKADLLEEFAAVVMRYETLALDVSWFGSSAARNEERQAAAFKIYNEEAVDLFSKWRALIARARLLADDKMSNTLKEMLRQTVFEKQDTPTIKLYNNKNTEASEWNAQHATNESVLASSYVVIYDLGVQLGVNEYDVAR